MRHEARDKFTPYMDEISKIIFIENYWRILVFHIERCGDLGENLQVTVV